MSTRAPSPGAHARNHERAPVRAEPLREENLALAARVQRLRSALEASSREIAELRREVAHLRAENAHLRGTHRPRDRGAATVHADRSARIRVMLRDQHSRNP